MCVHARALGHVCNQHVMQVREPQCVVMVRVGVRVYTHARVCVSLSDLHVDAALGELGVPCRPAEEEAGSPSNNYPSSTCPLSLLHPPYIHHLSLIHLSTHPPTIHPSAIHLTSIFYPTIIHHPSVHPSSIIHPSTHHPSVHHPSIHLHSYPPIFCHSSIHPFTIHPSVYQGKPRGAGMKGGACSYPRYTPRTPWDHFSLHASCSCARELYV